MGWGKILVRKDLSEFWIVWQITPAFEYIFLLFFLLQTDQFAGQCEFNSCTNPD